MWLAYALAASTTFSPDGAWAFDHWTQADGLPLEAVKYAVVDPSGYLWVATLEGLYRFDGDRFSLVHREALPGLRVNRITGLAPDPSGRLWVLDETGVVCRFDPSASTVDHASPVRAQCWPTERGALRVGPRGEVLAGDGRVRLLEDGPHPWPGLPAEGWVADLDATGAPLMGVRPAALGWYADGTLQTSPTPDGRPAALVEDGAGQRWVRSRDTLWRVDDTGLTPVVTPADSWLEDAEGWIWVRGARFEGRLRGDVVEARPSPWPVHLDGSYHGVRAADGALWESVNGWVGRDRVRFPLPGCRLSPDGGDGVWLACPDGLRHARRALGRARPPSDAAYVESRGVAIDAQGGHYETSRLGVWYRPPGGGEARPVVGPGGERIHVAAQTSPATGAEGAGEIRGEHAGASCVLREGACAGPLLPDEHASTALSDRYGPLSAHPLLLPGGRRLLSLFGGGLALLDPGGLARRTADSPGWDIRGFLPWGEGLWLGTEDRGLCHLASLADPLRAPIRCLDAGPVGTHVTDVRADGRGRLWLATNRGVVAVELAALEAWLAGREAWVPALRLDTRDGMGSRDTNAAYGRTAVDPDGWFWYPTMRGTAGLDVGRVRLVPPQAPRLEAVRVGGEPRPIGPVELPVDHAGVDLTWSVPEFVRPEQLWFRTRVGGDWSEPTQRREQLVDRLPPGETAFEVQASLGGAWSPVTRLELRRARAFHESWLFAPVLVVAGGAVVGSIAWARGAARRARQRALEEQVRRRTADLVAANEVVVDQRDRLRRQAIELEELGRLRSRLIANLSHELRTPLMLILAPLERLDREVPGRPPTPSAWSDATRSGSPSSSASSSTPRASSRGGSRSACAASTWRATPRRSRPGSGRRRRSAGSGSPSPRRRRSGRGSIPTSSRRW